MGLKDKTTHVLAELTELLEKRDTLLRKEVLTDTEKSELEILHEFVENLPLSLDSDTNNGFQIMRDYAKKIGENNRVKEE